MSNGVVRRRLKKHGKEFEHINIAYRLDYVEIYEDCGSKLLIRYDNINKLSELEVSMEMLKLMYYFMDNKVSMNDIEKRLNIKFKKGKMYRQGEEINSIVI